MTKKEAKAYMQRAAFVNRVRDAQREAYNEQERRTCDGDTKRAVYSALAQMAARILDEPYTPPPVTLKDVGRLADEIASAGDQGAPPSFGWECNECASRSKGYGFASADDASRDLLDHRKVCDRLLVPAPASTEERCPECDGSRRVGTWECLHCGGTGKAGGR